MKHFTILFTVLMMSCTSSNEAGMNGAWRYVSGNYQSDDSITKTTSDDINSIKIYTDNHYSVVTQIIAEDNFSAESLNLQLSSHSMITDVPPAKSTISG